VQRSSWLIVLALVVAAGCSAFGPRSFEVAFAPLPDAGIQALPTTLVDATGTVTAVIVAVDVPIVGDGPTAVAGDANSVVVTWMGGMCDRRVDLRLEERDGGLRLSGTTQADFGGCRLAGISRSLVIRFLLPVDVERFVVQVT
jgi:hypothetical protein